MMRALTTPFWAATLLVSLCGCGRRAAESQNPAPVADSGSNPAVLAWLEEEGNKTNLVPFTSALETLTKEQGWRDRLMKFLDDSPLIDWNEDWSIPVTVGSESYILKIRGGSSPFVPGEDIQVMILVDRKRVIQDVLACAVSNRVTSGEARFQTIAPLMAEPDGASAVIRLDGASARGNFEHTIIHDGQLRRYYWNQDNPSTNEPTRWDVRGLCRVAIVAGRFRLIFPDRSDQQST